jgi:SAM-dependent methyltransferase
MSHVVQSLLTPHPDTWVSRFAPLVYAGGRVLDVACGNGRHARLFLETDHPVTAIDRSVGAMDGLKRHKSLELIEADIETGPWPLAGRTFDAIVVVNYLHRPLLPVLSRSLTDGGILIYRTFGVGNEKYGKPTNPDFLLKPNELLHAFADLDVVAFESGDIGTAVVQRICAVKRESRRAGEEPLPLPV